MITTKRFKTKLFFGTDGYKIENNKKIPIDASTKLNEWLDKNKDKISKIHDVVFCPMATDDKPTSHALLLKYEE